MNTFPPGFVTGVPDQPWVQLKANCLETAFCCSNNLDQTRNTEEQNYYQINNLFINNIIQLYSNADVYQCWMIFIHVQWYLHGTVC